MGRYDKMTDEDFDRLLLKQMEEDGMPVVLSLPGVYEAVSEYYNNSVLTEWEEENPEIEEICRGMAEEVTP
jgi:hypothetical protein